MKCLKILTSICSIFAVQTGFASETCGSLAGMKGAVEILRSRDGADQVRNGFIVKRNLEPVQCNDVVLTGKDSAAKLLLGDVKIVMGAETRIEIAETLKGKSAGGQAQVSLLALSYGKLRALVKPKAASGEVNATGAAPQGSAAKPVSTGSRTGAQSDSESFRIKTATAVAGVRGTDFFTSYDPNTAVTDQATIEGSVMVRQLGSERSVLVRRGDQVSVEPSEAMRELVRDRGDDSLKDEKAKKRSLELTVRPIQEPTKNQLRAISSFVKTEGEFTSTAAIGLIGRPELWTDSRESPPTTDGLKNEF